MSFVKPEQWVLPSTETSNGCFETMRAYGGRIFRLESHLDRLYASAQFLGTRPPANRVGLSRQLTEALARSRVKDAVVRVALMPRRRSGHHRGGRGVPGAVGGQPTPARPSIVVQPATLPSRAAYRRGIRVAVVPARKFSVASINPQAKYSARLSSVLAVEDARLRRVDEALFMDAMGGVTESTASNIGLVSHGTIYTPPCWLGLLRGITRDVLFELAGSLQVPIREEPLTRHDLYNADEMFVMSTIKEMLPVTRIDGRKVGTGRPGPITARLQQAFRALVRHELALVRR